VNQINQNHNTMILLLVILVVAFGGGLAGLTLFTLLV